MKLRNALLVAAVLATLAPLGAQATHCDSPIYLFARHSYPGGPYQLPVPDGAPGAVPRQLRFLPSAAVSAIGCTASDPDVPHEASDSDVIYPGADTLQVRLLRHSDAASVESATMEYAGTTYELTLTNTATITGEPATFLDSQNISIDPATTVSSNTAVITICAAGECYSRTFRTVA